MISEQDRVRARSHMGYLNVRSAATFFLGVPAAVQTQFTIETALNNILPSAEAMFRQTLDRLDTLEVQVDENAANLAASKVGSIEVNLKEFDGIIQRYKYWQGKLGNMLGVTANPYDARPYLGSGYNGGGGVNVPVHH